MACAFEQDEDFHPQVEGGYWLVLDEDESPSLLKVLPDDELRLGYEEQLSIAAGNLSDMDVWEDELAIAEAEASRIRTFSLPSETQLQSYTLSPFQPHLIALGRYRIFAYDSVASQLLWLDKSNGRQNSLLLDGKTDLLGYLEPFFYLVRDSNRLLIWHEATLSQVEDTLLPEPIIFIIEHSILNRLMPITQQNGAQTLYNWDFGPRVLISEGPKVYQKRMISPYRRQQFGSEWVELIEQRGNGISSQGIQPVEDFTTDFFRSQLYYHFADSLWRYDLQTDQGQFLGAFPYRIRRSKFFPQ